MEGRKTKEGYVERLEVAEGGWEIGGRDQMKGGEVVGGKRLDIFGRCDNIRQYGNVVWLEGEV